jgi:hypothetical protein
MEVELEPHGHIRFFAIIGEKEEALMTYATYLFENRSPHLGVHQVIPLVEIDGLPVFVVIYIRTADVYIEITHNNICGCCRRDKIYDIDHKTTSTLTAEDVYIVLEKLTNVVDDLKLDKMDGRLSTTPKYYPTDCKFLKSPNVKSKYQECSVCYDLTTTLTTCRHPLCVRCWGQIKITMIDEEDDEYEQPCPICRKDLQLCAENH